MYFLNKKTILNILFFLLILGLIFYRGPCFLLEGTFQGDEIHFFKNAQKNGILDGLFYVYPGAGYFKLWTNISTTLASLFSFEVAKIIVTYFCLIAYLIIFIYIYFSNSELLLTKKYKIFAIFIILLSPPMTPEIWMSSAHTREYFGILAFILLFNNSKDDSIFKKKISNILIIISSLSSIWAVTLMPIYFLKYYYKKNKDNLINFFSSLTGFLIQSSIVVKYYLLPNVEQSTRFQVEISKIFSFIYNVPVRSFFGSTAPKKLFLETNLYNFQYFNFIAICIFIFTIIFLFIYLIKKRDLILNLIFMSFIFTSIFSILGSLYPDFAGGRYAVVPGVILIFFVLRIFILENNLLFKSISAILLLFSIVIGLVEFKYKSPLPDVLKCEYFKNIK